MTRGNHPYTDPTESCAGCCSAGRQAPFEAAWKTAFSRRRMLFGTGTAALAPWLLGKEAQPGAGTAAPRTVLPADELVVQPVLTYQVPKRREKTSWRPWGGIQTADQAAREAGRIEAELRELVAASHLALKLLPLLRVSSVEEAQQAAQSSADVLLIYAAGGGTATLEALVDPERANLFFLRHDTGPISLWYEILHPRLLRKGTDTYSLPGAGVSDVVVDEYPDLEWRLRSLLGLRRTLGQRVVAIGGAGGWGPMGKMGPQMADEKWRLDVRTVPYPELGEQIERLRRTPSAAADAAKQAAEYLSQPNIKLLTEKKYVENAFLLYRVFADLLAGHNARAITVQHCMGTIMPISDTTACLTLSLLNDANYLAFCESDFIVIPVGILMHHITGNPVFLNDPTWPHHGKVTVAHCTAPRKMDGRTYEAAEIHTHFESDFGAAPKVAMRPGQAVTMVVPDFSFQTYVGFKGTVVGNPLHEICRSQSDIAIEGDWPRLLQDMRGFHWMMVYGDCRREIGYAIRRLGIGWEDISSAEKALT